MADKEPAWIDSREVECNECRCGGWVGLQGRMLVHDHPCCPAFEKALADAGVEVVWVKDVAIS